MKPYTLLSALFLILTTVVADDSVKKTREVATYLQDISVTIKAQSGYSKSEGSGVLITREIDGQVITFVWTAAHVVDNLRNVREVIDAGRPRKLVEFKDAQIVKELVESGRRVGEIKMDASVIKYSDAEDGHDLALLMVRAKDYGKASARFHLNRDADGIIPISTELFHVGSLLGQMGANSMTTGIVSQVGRIHGKVEFDQTTVTAFPGSSGGGVYLRNGTYVGMLVRGAGEGFNLMVPIRRIKSWARKNDLEWALDTGEKMPSLATIRNMPVEDSGMEKKSGESADTKEIPFLIRTTILSDKK
jgi:S1-C subfamily serine protease